jgi:hypothetical protein
MALMKRLSFATAVAMLALPASALAASGHGVVLSVDSKHHSVQVVDASHVVHAYGYRGRLPRLHAGSKISFRRTGKAISAVKVSRQMSGSVAFLGRVVKSSQHGLVLRLADGKKVTFSANQVHHSKTKAAKRRAHAARSASVRAGVANVTINIQGLQPGVMVLITETVDGGNVTITISFPGKSDPVAGGEQTASGTVTEVDDDAFVLTTDDGSDLRLHMAAGRLAQLGLGVCDTLDVSYHQDAGMLIADHVNSTGSSTSGDCADNRHDQDVVGTITQVSGDSVTVATEDQGTMTFSVDSSDTTDGYQAGDVVDVTYYDNGDGTYSADDVEWVEQDSTGTVTDVSDGSMTITDDQTGHAVTFVADPSDAVFDGVAVGDQVDVTHHQSGDQQVADSVDDSGGGD